MRANNHREDESESTDEGIERRTVLKSVAVASATAGVLGGATANASAHPTPHEIVVKPHSDHVRYRIEVSGEIVKGPNADGTDEITDEHVAVGKLPPDDEFDDFRFSGKVVDLEVTKGEAKFIVKRKSTRKDEKEEKEEKKKRKERKEGKKDEKKKKDADRKQKHEVSIHAEGPHVDYEFVVDGDVWPGDEADIGVGDEIDDGVVTGTIAGSGVDNYLFTGEITKFQIPRRAPSDEATVRIDGEKVDVEDLGEFHYVSIHAEGPHVDYEFVVDGEVEPASEADIEIDDRIDDGVVTGNVAGSHGFDNYWFTGEIEKFHVSRDDVTVRLDGEELDLSDD